MNWMGGVFGGTRAATRSLAPPESRPEAWHIRSPFAAGLSSMPFPAVRIYQDRSSSGERYLKWTFLSQWPTPDTEEHRAVGERFYISRPDLLAQDHEWQDLLSCDGQSIEVHVVSWCYPTIYEDRSEATGIIDLTG